MMGLFTVKAVQQFSLKLSHEAYAAAINAARQNQTNVQNVPRIQRNIIRFPTKIVRKKSIVNTVYLAIAKRTGEKKTALAGGFFGGGEAYLAAAVM